MPKDTPTDPVDAIASALTRLRGRRMPRPPWDSAHSNHAGHTGHGSHESGHRPHEPGWMRGGPHHGRPHAGPPWAGSPPWGAGQRFGGPARLRLLEALAAASAPLSVSEIGDAIGVDQPRASRLVQQVVEQGLARREADPDDARRSRVALTDQGVAVVRGFRGERRDAIDTALAEFTDAERADLARLLTKLADAWPR